MYKVTVKVIGRNVIDDRVNGGLDRVKSNESDSTIEFTAVDGEGDEVEERRRSQFVGLFYIVDDSQWHKLIRGNGNERVSDMELLKCAGERAEFFGCSGVGVVFV